LEGGRRRHFKVSNRCGSVAAAFYDEAFCGALSAPVVPASVVLAEVVGDLAGWDAEVVYAAYFLLGGRVVVVGAGGRCQR
jgi:hypothetical protein